ncbi:hypothetical protein [Actinopolymorpha pittospori]|uniref:Uncharacterized protein n=1 Tax=Actinopolymorpha pittospori TaxID=648752 RepID=A0A927RBE9_9ACTN|nr:hypothetical protein [Actinopolymorpha pittospori]MBE1606000.1 hypothetical protein [Actinopolymorpha pittospori]
MTADAVTAEQVAALRALLAGDLEEHVRLRDQLDREAAATGYTALLAAAFFEAVDRRFGQDGASADMAAFVSDVRSRTTAAAESIDPPLPNA